MDQPVIVISEDSKAAEAILELLKKEVTCDLELMTELNEIGGIDLDDPHYQRAKKKLDKDRVVVIVTKEASRGVDFQFKPGTPPAHVIINFAVTKTSELIQAIGRSCRQLSHEKPSWQPIYQDKDGCYGEDYILSKLEGKESNLSMLGN